jgi:hypothetical protein
MVPWEKYLSGSTTTSWQKTNPPWLLTSDLLQLSISSKTESANSVSMLKHKVHRPNKEILQNNRWSSIQSRCSNRKRSIYSGNDKMNQQLQTRSLPNPNCCSSRIPMNSKLNMLTIRWTRPAWSHIQLMRRHPWCSWTTLAQLSAPIFSKLPKEMET